MSLDDAADIIVNWFSFLRIRIASMRFVREVECQHFQVTIFQAVVVPDQAELVAVKRVFELVPLDVPDCYEVKEIAA